MLLWHTATLTTPLIHGLMAIRGNNEWNTHSIYNLQLLFFPFLLHNEFPLYVVFLFQTSLSSTFRTGVLHTIDSNTSHTLNTFYSSLAPLANLLAYYTQEFCSIFDRIATFFVLTRLSLDVQLDQDLVRPSQWLRSSTW